MTGEAGIWQALREVVDPELGINIVDLGLVYAVEVAEGRVRVAMTMTSPACPMNAYLAEAAETAIRLSDPSASEVRIELVWEPPWSPAMMSEAAKRQLGIT